MKRRSGLLAAALLSCSVLAASDTPARYHALAPLNLAPGEGLQRLPLPWPVLQASRSTALADLRIFDAQGQAVPIAWAQPVRPAEQQRRLAVPRFAWPDAPPAEAPGTTDGALQLRLGTGGAVLQIVPGPARAAPAGGAARVWLLDLSALQPADGERLSRIALDWPRRTAGLDTQVSAEASRDGRLWRPVAQAQLLDLPEPGAEGLRLRHIAWPDDAEPPRYVRLRFEQALLLNASEVELSRAGAAAALLQQPVRFEPVAASGREPAAWLLDLQGPIAPRALRLQLPEPNSRLALHLEQRERADGPWRPVARFVAWRLLRGGQESRSETLALPQATPARWWRLRPEGGEPVERPLDAQLGWQAPQLVLLAQGGAAAPAGFRLAVGREQAMPVALPLPGLIPGYRDGAEQALPEASLGPLAAQPEPGWRERLGQADAAERRRWALWGVLIAGMLGLGLLARRLLRQIATPPPA